MHGTQLIFFKVAFIVFANKTHTLIYIYIVYNVFILCNSYI